MSPHIVEIKVSIEVDADILSEAIVEAVKLLHTGQYRSDYAIKIESAGVVAAGLTYDYATEESELESESDGSLFDTEPSGPNY